MRSRIFFAFAMLFIVQIELHAAGFDKSYQVYKGDLSPADGWIDLYIRGTGPVPIVVDEISFIIPPAVIDFVLKNNGNGTFNVVAPLSIATKCCTHVAAS